MWEGHIRSTLESVSIHNFKNKEYWWSILIKIAMWSQHNMLDVVLWDMKQEYCITIQIEMLVRYDMIYKRYWGEGSSTMENK